MTPKVIYYYIVGGRMKEQYLKLFSFLFGITFIVSGVIFTYCNTFKVEKDKKIEEDKAISDEIGDVYKTFFDKEQELTKYRDEYEEKMSSFVTFYSEMPSQYKDMIEMVKKYEEYVKESEDISYYLKDKCTKKYSSSDANEKCNAYYINLEKTINSFIEDVRFFNSKIDEYNKWAVDENDSVIATVKYEPLENYTMEKYKDFVDLNEDGTYLGMNSD